MKQSVEWSFGGASDRIFVGTLLRNGKSGVLENGETGERTELSLVKRAKRGCDLIGTAVKNGFNPVMHGGENHISIWLIEV